MTDTKTYTLQILYCGSSSYSVVG